MRHQLMNPMASVDIFEDIGDDEGLSNDMMEDKASRRMMEEDGADDRGLTGRGKQQQQQQHQYTKSLSIGQVRLCL